MDFFQIDGEAVGGLAVADVEVAVEVRIFLDDEFTGDFARRAFFVDEAIAVGIDADDASTFPSLLPLIFVLGHWGPTLPTLDTQRDENEGRDDDGPALPLLHALPASGGRLAEPLPTGWHGGGRVHGRSNTFGIAEVLDAQCFVSLLTQFR